MTEQRKKLIERFDKWLDSKPRKQIISAQCANIAEEYAKEQLLLHNVVGQSEQLLALAQYMCEHQNNLDGNTAKDYLQDFLSQ